MQKIFIVSANKNIESQRSIAEYLSNKLDVEIANNFTTARDHNESKYIDLSWFDQLSIDDVTIAFKNNSLLYCENVTDTETIGITIDEYYNKRIFCTSVAGFNNIPEHILNDDIIVIWVDSIYNPGEKNDANEVKYLLETLEDVKYLYFSLVTDSIKDISKTIYKYLISPETVQAELEDELS